MPNFRFALSSTTAIREAGMIQSESFSDAMEAISERLTVNQGDTLEIGVIGFPPARYECVFTRGGTQGWRPAGLLAA